MSHQDRVQQWRDYFLQNHQIVFVRNSPTRTSSSRSPCSHELSSSTYSSSTSSTEIILADQRQTLNRAHHRELSQARENWQTEISRHLVHIEKLLTNIHQLEALVSQ